MSRIDLKSSNQTVLRCAGILFFLNDNGGREERPWERGCLEARASWRSLKTPSASFSISPPTSQILPSTPFLIENPVTMVSENEKMRLDGKVKLVSLIEVSIYLITRIFGHLSSR